MMPDLVQNLVDWYRWRTLVNEINKDYHESWGSFDNNDGMLVYKHKFENYWRFFMHWRWDLNNTYKNVKIIKVEKYFRYPIFNIQKTKMTNISIDFLLEGNEDPRVSANTHKNFVYSQLYPD